MRQSAGLINIYGMDLAMSDAVLANELMMQCLGETFSFCLPNLQATKLHAVDEWKHHMQCTWPLRQA